jgi:hypothetical protein
MLNAPRFRNNSSRKCCKNIVSRKAGEQHVSSSSDRMAALRACVLASEDSGMLMPCDTDESLIVADAVPLIADDAINLIQVGNIEGDVVGDPPLDPLIANG